MHRVILLKVGGAKVHLLKVVGALLVCGGALGVLSAIAELFRTIKQVELAATAPALAEQVFGLTQAALTSDVILGLLTGPAAFFMIWLAVFVAGAMVYRSGSVILPIEEDSEDVKRA
jgi:hypothetical protein